MTREEYVRTSAAKLIGRKGHLNEEVRNGNIVVPAGTLVTITGKLAGLRVESTPCPSCGVRVVMTRVMWTHVDLLPP